ncbi:hypothetical protein KAFR_0D03830 [Kazachstania africana CBS 2517]|uniref:Folic acid synthesis protein fol1 n=1 Tax=Kazachstania africana (strain ATCC 22294 / BCRC 22015 / CBS 2517 / CECT 1963 / NBRC 1671 / NRRL Y-8276) TaxID=1071382 RepID=H2AUI1_KAZAF|nr:hypothetical protein KAFR_0D03830 [Kazachstania africana CBS 2517]CCF58031.1 hypothetical protein KAFR_0D03830 [Kazachstania africana CBS 2517]
MKMNKDNLHIKNLKLKTITGPNLWNQIQPQNCRLSVDVETNFSECSRTDDLKYSLNYASLASDITKFVKKKENWNSLNNLSKSVYDYVQDYKKSIKSLEVSIQNENLHARTNKISWCYGNRFNRLMINDLKVMTIIGIFNFERVQKQTISIDLTIESKNINSCSFPIKKIINDCVTFTENSDFKTVEALAEAINNIVAEIIDTDEDTIVTVKVMKLNAITDTDSVGVSCQRKASKLINAHQKLPSTERIKAEQPSFDNETVTNGQNTVYLSFGSNIGDRIMNIQEAIKILDEHESITVKNISSFFESEPMYYLNQNQFINGCVECQTILTPRELLKAIKDIEYNKLNRVKEFDNGPRTLDLDIIMYLDSKGNQIIVNEPDLIVPHDKMLERSFVLEPLCELIPSNFEHPISTEPISKHLSAIYERGNDEDYLWKVIPIPNHNKETEKGTRFLKFKTICKTNEFTAKRKRITISPTYLMGILNTTPDSFSDGGKYNTLEKQLDCIKVMCQEHFKLHENIIIDVGGCSTRPNSVQATVEEELARTIPIIEQIRQCKELPQDKIIISIDTYRSEVAEKAIQVGADIINDISGGAFDSDLFNIISSHPNVAYVLSHTRGDIATMTKLTSYDEFTGSEGCEFFNEEEYTGNNLKFIRVLGRELATRYQIALSKGVRRWQIIVDPGLGFAKDLNSNLKVIRELPFLKNYSFLEDGTNNYTSFRNLPFLLGPSRKKFIGTITKDDDAQNRDFATGSIVASCIGFGADLVRVHNVADCSKSIKLADATYKLLE